MNDLRQYNDLNNGNSKMGVLQVTKQMFKLMVLLFVSIQSLTVAIQENHTTVDDIKAQLGLQATKAPTSLEPKNCPSNTGLIVVVIFMFVLIAVLAFGNACQFVRNRKPKKKTRSVGLRKKQKKFSVKMSVK